MVTSATYRQSSAVTKEAFEKDRDNRWLARVPRYRMDAEMIRDYALASSGLMVRKIAGPYFKKIQATLSPDPQIVPPINQDGKTDLAFLQELAQKYHAKCFVELDETGEEVLYFLPERRIVTLRRPETLILRYRCGPDSALISFAPAFDSGYIDRLKEINDIDDKGRKIKNKDKPQTDIVVGPLPDDVVGRANSADRPIIRKLYDLGKASKLELQKTLTAKRTTVGKVAANQTELDAENDALEGRRLGMTATGTTFGNIWLRAKYTCVRAIRRTGCL